MEEKISFRPADNLSHDAPASIVVFLVALPLCLGIALACGAPLFSGLLAGIIGGVVAGSLSKSSVSVSGPAAGLTTIVAAATQELGSFPLFLTALVIAGLVQMVLGYLKLGELGHFFPVAVIRGMLAAIGLILILKQIPHALGYDTDFEGDESFYQPDGQNTFTEIVDSVQNVHPGALLLAVLSIGILFLWSRPFMKKSKWIKYVPGPMVVVGLGIGLRFFLGNFSEELRIGQGHLVDLPDITLDDIGSSLVRPDWSGLRTLSVYKVAVILATVASVETLLNIEAGDKLDPLRRITPLNHELKAQGVSNFISGLLGGLPVTAVIVRTTANVQAGGRTNMSTIFHGIMLGAFVLAFPSILEMIPLASLAAILIILGCGLNSPSVYKSAFEKGKTQFLPFLVTIVGILFTDLLTGIFLGTLVSVFFVLKTNFRSAIILVNNHHQYLLKFTKDVSFVHKSALRKALAKVPSNSFLMIDGSRSNFLDADILETIEDFVKGAFSKNITVEMKKTPEASNAYFKKTDGASQNTRGILTSNK
jgi:MFS superfamily sulfate permease-like transporter